MNIADADRLRGDYLTRLDAALRNVPHGVAAEIRAGILEELQGLDAAATAVRIGQLGDPEAVAREAQEDVPVQSTAAPSVRNAPATSTRGFAITAALTLSFGGIVLPFAGWVVGAVLVCFSSLWRTWEKAVAIVVPLLALIITAGVGWIAFGADAGVTESAAIGSGIQEAANNPLLPATYDIMWTALLVVGILLIPASGLWLLWRLRAGTRPRP